MWTGKQCPRKITGYRFTMIITVWRSVRSPLLPLMLALLLLAARGRSAALAQDEPDCAESLLRSWVMAGETCLAARVGTLCAGGELPQLERKGDDFASEAVSAQLLAASVAAIISAPLLPAGAPLWLRPAALPLSALLIGEVTLRDVSAAGLPAWHSLLVQTAPARPLCSAAPGNALVLQSLSESSAVNLVVNGASLQLRGTLVVRTAAAQTQFIALEGEARVLARGQEGALRSGLQLDVPNSQGDFAQAGGPPGEIRPLEYAAIAGLPVGLFERPLHLPQPGIVMTFGAVNLRAAPDLQGALLASVASGETLTVLGRNPAGDWLHLRRENGQSGWMFAELLFQNLGELNAVYEATPLPPQRYGRLGGSGRVIAPTGVNLRRGPHVRFALLGSLPAGSEVTLLERSPYSPWVKIEFGEVVGWVLLAALQTDAWLPSLPLAAGVPQPPAPTRVPGSYDNAFPRGG